MKKLQERLKAGIDFNPKKDPCYDSIVEEAETILGMCSMPLKAKKFLTRTSLLVAVMTKGKTVKSSLFVVTVKTCSLWKLKTNLFVSNLMNVMLSL